MVENNEKFSISWYFINYKPPPDKKNTKSTSSFENQDSFLQILQFCGWTCLFLEGIWVWVLGRRASFLGTSPNCALSSPDRVSVSSLFWLFSLFCFPARKLFLHQERFQAFSKRHYSRFIMTRFLFWKKLLRFVVKNIAKMINVQPTVVSLINTRRLKKYCLHCVTVQVADMGQPAIRG